MAFLLGHENVTDLLLKNGANVSLTDEIGQTALHMAAFYGLFLNISEFK